MAAGGVERKRGRGGCLGGVEVHLQMEMTGASDDGSVLCYCRGIGVPAII